MLIYSMLCEFRSSDSPICNLDPLESDAFDASRCDGVTAAHLTSLMNLTFIGDEKLASNPLFPRPPSPNAELSSEVDPGDQKSPEMDSVECLEKQLDDDMARTLAEDHAVIGNQNFCSVSSIGEVWGRGSGDPQRK